MGLDSVYKIVARKPPTSVKIGKKSYFWWGSKAFIYLLRWGRCLSRYLVNLKGGWLEFFLEEFASFHPLWEVLVVFVGFGLFESLVCCSGEGYYAFFVSVVFGEPLFLQ